MPARAREVDREPSRHLASEHAPRRRPRPDARRGHGLVGVGVDSSPRHGDAPERSRVDRGRSVELERHSRPLQPWLRAASARECPGSGDARRASCARLRARRLVVRPLRLLVGAEYRRQRPVRHDRRGDGSSPPARARARPRVRHVDGRARERARGRTGSRNHRRRAFDMRARRRRDPSQQLPARRGVRDREAPHACSRTQARRFREPGRGRRVRSRVDRGGTGGPDDSRRPRTASLVFALLNVVPVAPGVPEPAPNDAAAIEAAQYASAVQSFPLLDFIQFGRYWIELAAGGNGSWTRGEDFAELLSHSPYHDVVRKLYRTAGLDLKADLEPLDAGAAIGADPDAIASLEETSVPTGKLAVPQLTLHTTADPLVPVQHENVYADVVRRAATNSLLRQAYRRPLGPLQLHAGRVGGGRRGAQASGRDRSLGLRRAAADAASIGERPRPRRRSVRAV